MKKYLLFIIITVVPFVSVTPKHEAEKVWGDLLELIVCWQNPIKRDLCFCYIKGGSPISSSKHLLKCDLVEDSGILYFKATSVEQKYENKEDSKSQEKKDQKTKAEEESIAQKSNEK